MLSNPVPMEFRAFHWVMRSSAKVIVKRETYICQNCWATVTIEVEGADITYSAKGSRITIHREGAETFLGRLKWASVDRVTEKIFPRENKCPACNPFGLFP